MNDDKSNTSWYGQYDHLNKDSKLTVTVEMDELVERIEAMNYGTQRFLSALVCYRLSHPKRYGNDQLTEVIGAALQRGCF